MPDLSTTTSESPAAVNHAALSGVRFLVSRRIEELENAATAGESDLGNAQAAREGASLRCDELEQRWEAMMQRLPDVAPGEIDALFRRLANARADLAAADERAGELSVRLRSVRSEQEMLRSVHRSLDDLAAASAGRGEGTTRLRSASRQVFQIIEEERMRIARDMHDGPAQSMANLVLQAEILERLIQRDPAMVVRELHDFKDGVRGVLDDTRRLIFDLRPMTLDDLGLVPTLRKFVKEFGERSGIATSLRVVGEEARLSGSLEPTLFRIVQEALNNARKHAHASNVEVIVTFQPSFVSAVVRDDGVGMDVASTEAGLDATRHLGLISMRERAELERGRLEIRSEPGHGTEVRISFDR
jgi:two-component system, NarL family, sensor histidine kinase DegS